MEVGDQEPPVSANLAPLPLFVRCRFYGYTFFALDATKSYTLFDFSLLCYSTHKQYALPKFTQDTNSNTKRAGT